MYLLITKNIDQVLELSIGLFFMVLLLILLHLQILEINLMPLMPTTLP